MQFTLTARGIKVATDGLTHRRQTLTNSERDVLDRGYQCARPFTGKNQ